MSDNQYLKMNDWKIAKNFMEQFAIQNGLTCDNCNKGTHSFVYDDTVYCHCCGTENTKNNKDFCNDFELKGN